jgi:hypothetical protein
MKTITDEYMLEMRGKARAYAALILKPGPRYKEPGADKIIWEHGRRNHALRAEGLMPIVTPVVDGRGVCGIAFFATSLEEADRIMRDDPGVKEGVFTYELYACRGLPGDALPE